MRSYRRREEPELAAGFRKDPRDENFLEHLNTRLADDEERDYRDLDETLPTLHVVGAPRSGTTLMYQVIAGGLEIGYVNNLMAAFWLAPATGVRLARKLGLGAAGPSSFQSRFGRTAAIDEPHEFGYFWNHHLRYPDLTERGPDHEASIDWRRLRRVLLNMADAWGGPMAFKPMLLTWHLEAMVRHMPRTCLVWIRREPRDTALSLLKMRRALFGSYDIPASLVPRDMPRDAPPWTQVAAQVTSIERTIERAAARIGPEHVLPVRYERLCADPAGVVEDVRALMGPKGGAPARRPVELHPFAPQRNAELDSRFGDLVDEALAACAARTG